MVKINLTKEQSIFLCISLDNYLIDMNCKEDEMKINRITKQIRNKLQNKLH